MKIILNIITSCFITLLFVGCGTKRKIIDKTPKITIKTYNYYKTDNKEKLKLDLYKSVLFKNTLPLIIYVHGGGFSGGARDEDFIKNYCLEMTKNGFSVASISYNLTMKKHGFGCNTASDLKIKAFNSVAKDISLATNFLLKHKNKFGIDANNIILVGSSAGAEAILNLVYGGYHNTILPKKFKYAGLIAMAGAITSLKNITKENAIPTQLFHATKDKLVPYNIASHHYCNRNSKGYLILYGSKAISKRLKLLNKPFYLFTIRNGNHSWNVKPMYLNITEMLSFINEQVLQKESKQVEIFKDESDYIKKKT